MEWETFQAQGVNFLIDVVVALLILGAGVWLAGWCSRMLRKILGKRQIEPVVATFLGNIARIAIIGLAIVISLDQAGVDTTALAAVLAAAGLAVGLALQGSLANFAAGTLLILFRPFKEGDFVEAGGSMGIVEEIGLLLTVMRTPDNKKVFVPNSNVLSNTVTNFTANDTRRMDLVIGVAYDSDLKQVKETLMGVLTAHATILKDPVPVVEVANYGDSSIDFWVRPWVNTSDYWDIYFELHMTIKEKLDAAGVTIPFPQRDVHLFQEGRPA
jgi:small conductance mechanosensitive channel